MPPNDSPGSPRATRPARLRSTWYGVWRPSPPQAAHSQALRPHVRHPVSPTFAHGGRRSRSLIDSYSPPSRRASRRASLATAPAHGRNPDRAGTPQTRRMGSPSSTRPLQCGQ